ncbi:hypothetical protein WMY93_006455 [Mugilogobius chulae]|uniref:Uncharacterized protein n=1 Tax=Mugilogobius chulae TaxID=88201 RepID=A0AAW0PJV9_9GOBI
MCSLKATIRKQKPLKIEVRQRHEGEEKSDPKPSTSKQASREEQNRNSNNKNNRRTNSCRHSRQVERIRGKRKSLKKLKLMRWTIKSLETIFQDTKTNLEAAMRRAHCAEDRQKLKSILKSLLDSFKATRKEHKAFTTELRQSTTEEEEGDQDSLSQMNDSLCRNAGQDKIMGQTQESSEQESRPNKLQQEKKQKSQSIDSINKPQEKQEQRRAENDSLLRKLKHESDLNASLTNELENVKKELEDMRTLCESFERKTCVTKLHNKMLEDSLKATRKELQDTKVELSKLEQKSTKEAREEEQRKKNTTEKEKGENKLVVQEVEPYIQDINSIGSEKRQTQTRPEGRVVEEFLS